MRQKDQMEQNDHDTDPGLNRPISLDEIRFFVRKLKNRKATGLDRIPNEVLKNNNVMVILHNLFDKFFMSGFLPSVWLRAIINPIPKSASKDPHIPLNYRGISILSCVGKVFSGIINTRVVKYCEENNVFEDEQNGFRKNRSCEDHIFVLTSIIRNRLTMGKDTFCAFVDMQKAFDWVDRDLLFYKLLKYNIRGNIYKCIKALYSHPLARVKVNNNVTEWFEINSGVRQGDSLSPSLFGLFINDLISEIKDLNIGIKIKDELVSILAFADDNMILVDNEEDLQKMLKHVELWCAKWRLKVNTDKTNIVHFRKKNTRITRFNFYFDGIVLNIVDRYKYLGTMLQEHLDMLHQQFCPLQQEGHLEQLFLNSRF